MTGSVTAGADGVLVSAVGSAGENGISSSVKYVVARIVFSRSACRSLSHFPDSMSSGWGYSTRRSRSSCENFLSTTAMTGMHVSFLQSEPVASVKRHTLRFFPINLFHQTLHGLSFVLSDSLALRIEVVLA